ncbi:hypothetical protein ACF3NT_11095 [Naumannella halotolerans]|uniref:Insertion element protein n=1 Tax=Naumannella halotolerans TaxID=993414 RepID=A0A4R7J4S0_9ACTN|nr:hypothetical protein [Naumannella halotolerans]TDT31389.1 hypothetical protein CLV29_2811 [Naumannella halotolerans]
MSEQVRAVPYFCPFCGEEDLRPVEEPSNGWLCRPCARVYSVTLHRIEKSLVPGHLAASQEDPE